MPNQKLLSHGRPTIDHLSTVVVVVAPTKNYHHNIRSLFIDGLLIENEVTSLGVSLGNAFKSRATEIGAWGKSK
jgi:hypothetical protein